MHTPKLNSTPNQNLLQTNPPVKVIAVQYQKPLNLIIVRGSSILDHSELKYSLLSRDIERHLSTQNSLHLYFNFDYFDSSALAYMASIITTLNDFHKKGKKIKLFWSCFSTAKNMGDEGAKLQTLCNFEFNT